MAIILNNSQGTTPPQRSMYESYRLTARIRDKYSIEELRKLCSDDDAIKNFLEMLASKPDW